MIFDSNVFKENLGLMGGAISINSPNAQQSQQRNRKAIESPVIILTGNTFDSNQGYIIGNAVSVRYRWNRNEVSTQKANTVCGGGFYATSNEFFNNTAVLHSSAGGAISLTCDFYPSLSNEASSEMQDSLNAFSKTVIADPIDYDTYPAYKYASVIENNNTFYGNEVGQKGSAIYVRQISMLRVKSNVFRENQPSYSFRKTIVRPYEKYFLAPG